MVLHKSTRANIDLIKVMLRENICSDRSSLDCFKEESVQLLDILERFIEFGVSDSVLIIGPPGCGKSSFVKKSIDDVLKKNGEHSVTMIKLNGLIHTNDNLALQEIIRSLHVDDLPEGTMVTGSFGDNLNFVLQSFKSGNRDASKPIIFIMDEFEYFCEHVNQTLLYNLFDVTQTAQAPICVIGITGKIDIVELFEKRVKSRFSHREISLYPSSDFKFYLKLIEDTLTINGKSELSLSIKTYIREWNSTIKELLLNKNVIKNIRKVSEIDSNLRLFQNILFCLTNCLNETHPVLVENDFEEVISLFYQDRKVFLIKDLSNLEIGLIIAMKHQNEIYDCEPMNFEIIYQRYKKFAIKSSVNAVEYTVVYKGFERLKELEVIVPVSGPGRRTKKKEHILYSFVLTNEQIKEALSSYENLPTDLTQWASSSLASE